MAFPAAGGTWSFPRHHCLRSQLACFRLDDCLELVLDAAANGEEIDDDASLSEDSELMEVRRARSSRGVGFTILCQGVPNMFIYINANIYCIHRSR